MSYYSEYYLEEFENDVVKKLTIILNKIEIHSKQKYLLIVAKDLETDKIVKLIDAHGAKHDLCKYSDDWAKLNTGDVISVKCEFYNSQYCVNVLRIKSNYTLIESIDLIEELKAIEETLLKEDELSLDSTDCYFDLDFLRKEQKKEKFDCFSMTYRPDLYFLSKKFSGKYGFMLYYLTESELIEYKKNDSSKVKYQFELGYYRLPCYADIEFSWSDIENYIGQYYTGFVLLQFTYKNDRLRAKVYNLFGNDRCFKTEDENDPF